MFCLQCGKEIGSIVENRICPYCGMEQYSVSQVSMNSYVKEKHKKVKK